MTPQQFLKDTRIKLGLNRKAVAREMGLSFSQFEWLENGRSRLTFDMAVKLCSHYRVSLLVLAALVDEHMGMEGAG